MDIPVLLWGDVAVHLPLRAVVALGVAAPVIGDAVAPVLRRRLGAKDVLQWMVPRHGTAEADHVAVCRFLARHHEVGGWTCRKTRHRALLAAIGLGWLEAGEWLATHLRLTRRHARMDNNRALHEAVYAGRLDVCQWLVARFHLTTQDVCADKYAALRFAAGGSLAVFQWLIAHFRLNVTPRAVNRLLLSAAGSGQLGVCEWLASHTTLLAAPPGDVVAVALLHATEFRHYDVCRWLIVQFYGELDNLDWGVRHLRGKVRGRKPKMEAWLDALLARRHGAQENK